jgi:hypothetical protein
MQDPVMGADNVHGAPYDRLAAGIVSTGAAGAGPLTVFTDLVGYGYDGPLSAIRCNGVGAAPPAALASAAPAETTLEVLTAPAETARARGKRPVRFRARER